jgi:putative ABC transport system ATP-binding protein
MRAMLDIVGLHRTGLSPTTFRLQDGACIAVRGPSGAGKSLLLRALADLDPSAGSVSLDGEDRERIPAPVWRRRVLYVPAQSGWWADTVGAHFTDWQLALPLLAQLKLSADSATWPVARCSTGELARFALVRALLRDPRVLLLDEPTAALDAETVAAVEDIIRQRIDSGVSALWVTHDRAQAGRVASRLLLVEAGVVREAPEP